MLRTAALGAALAAGSAQVNAHMTIWTKSMYGVGEDFAYDVPGQPCDPIGPGLTTQSDWWFRGPAYRALTPMARSDGEVTALPAGGSVTFEIACHIAWTSYGVSPTVPGSQLDACPGNSGAFHAGDPSADDIDPSAVSGCALAIADKDDIEKVGWDDLTIFSVQHDCVKQKMTSFDVPAKMPSCTGDKCICGWFWLANYGTANFYMTAFDCKVTNSPADALPIAPPQDPVWCGDDPSTCTKGAKRPLYAYNSPTNVPFWSNDDRPGYHQDWSFGTNGAQNDIFVTATNVTSTTASAAASSSPPPSSSSASSSSVAPSSSFASSSAPALAASPVSSTSQPSSSPLASSSTLTSSSSKASTVAPSSSTIVAPSTSTSSIAPSTGPPRSSSTGSLASSPSPSSSSSSLVAVPITTSRTTATVAPTTSSSVAATTATTSKTTTTTTTATTTTTTKATTTTSASLTPTLVNLAARATVAASSEWTNSPAIAVKDGKLGGYISNTEGDETVEWSSYGEGVGARVQLKWSTAVSLNQIVLFDRPNTVDQVTAGTVTFADGKAVSFGVVENTGKVGLALNFSSTISTTSIKVLVTGVSPSTQQSGFSEIQVFLADATKFPTATRLTPTLPPVIKTTTTTAAPQKTQKPRSGRVVRDGSRHVRDFARAQDEIAAAAFEAKEGLTADAMFEPSLDEILQDEPVRR